MSSSEINAYAQAVGSGLYDRVTGLRGKYDNVRVHWEDQAVRLRLAPHLQTLVDRRNAEGRKLRLTDLGCGSGDGLETLMGMFRTDAPAASSAAELLRADIVERYTGVELNPALLEQARDRHRYAETARFIEGDLRAGLPFEAGDPAYDVYFASFGTLSHLSEDDAVKLIAELARHAEDGALLVADWLGRYAYEWTDLWQADASCEHWMDYRISYIYSAEERKQREIDSFPLRLLGAVDARRAFERAQQQTGFALVEKDLFDRSLFVGRHMETGDYNPHALPLRTAVNRLHEPLCRTNLDDLLFELHLPEGAAFAQPKKIIRRVYDGWQTLVRFTRDCLQRSDAGEALPDIPAGASPTVHAALQRMRTAVSVMHQIEADDPRSEWVEPQLGLALRNVELGEQQGCGCGHGLVAIYEVSKK